MNAKRVNKSQEEQRANAARIQAARVLVASSMVKACAINARARGNEELALRFEAEIVGDLAKHGELIISDDDLIVNGEHVTMHLILNVIPRDKVPVYTTPNARCERGLHQQFALFRAACEMYWGELNKKLNDVHLSPMHIIGESFYGWDEHDPMRISVYEYFTNKNGRVYLFEEDDEKEEKEEKEDEKDEEKGEGEKQSNTIIRIVGK